MHGAHADFMYMFLRNLNFQESPMFGTGNSCQYVPQICGSQPCGWQYLADFLATPRITDKEISALPLSGLGGPLFLEFQLRMAGSIASATVPG